MALSVAQIVFLLIKKRNKLFIGFFLVAFCTQCGTKEEVEEIPFYNTAEFTAEWIPKNDSKYNDIHRISEFSFQNQVGKTITNDMLKHKIYVANFFFTSCPSICPKMTINLKEIQDEFIKDPDVLILSHTVMPWKDTQSVLNEYDHNQGVDSNIWHLLTGSREDIYTIARNSYFAEKGIGLQKTTDEFLHTENFLLIDGKGRIRGVFNGTLPLETQRLIKTIYLLKKET